MMTFGLSWPAETIKGKAENSSRRNRVKIFFGINTSSTWRFRWKSQNIKIAVSNQLKKIDVLDEPREK